MERWIQSIGRKHLDHFVPVELQHLSYLVSGYLVYCDRERLHQSLGNRPPAGHDLPDPRDEIVCRSRLGGVLRHDEREAA